MLLLIQVALLAMLGYNLWSRASSGEELELVSVLATVGIGILAVLTAVRWHRERADDPR